MTISPLIVKSIRETIENSKIFVSASILKDIDMKKKDFSNILDDLGLTQVEAAKLLSVNLRTVRRWSNDPNEIPGPARQAILAWLRLHRIGIPWRPDGVDSVSIDNHIDNDKLAEHIMEYRNNSIQLEKILEKVEERGGPAAPWKIDLKKHVAILGPIKLWFRIMSNGGFSPTTYSRVIDCYDPYSIPDVARDWVLLEDAFKCIQNAINGVKDD